MTLRIELEREDDGRWLAEVPALAGVLCYGNNRDDAVVRMPVAGQLMETSTAALPTFSGPHEHRFAA